jgi:hypothetical protein
MTSESILSEAKWIGPEEATLLHHLFKISIAKLISAISTDAKKNDRRFIVPPLERR